MPMCLEEFMVIPELNHYEIQYMDTRKTIQYFSQLVTPFIAPYKIDSEYIYEYIRQKRLTRLEMLERLSTSNDVITKCFCWCRHSGSPYNSLDSEEVMSIPEVTMEIQTLEVEIPQNTADALRINYLRAHRLPFKYYYWNGVNWD